MIFVAWGCYFQVTGVTDYVHGAHPDKHSSESELTDWELEVVRLRSIPVNWRGAWNEADCGDSPPEQNGGVAPGAHSGSKSKRSYLCAARELAQHAWNGICGRRRRDVRHATAAGARGQGSALSRSLIRGAIENLELPGRLPVVCGPENVVCYFSLVSDDFLQGEGVSVQLLGKMQ